MEKDRESIKDTKDTVCLSDGRNVTITHVSTTVESRPRNPVFLRVECWDCDKSQDCNNMECLGKIRNGKTKGWAQ